MGYLTVLLLKRLENFELVYYLFAMVPLSWAEALADTNVRYDFSYFYVVFYVVLGLITCDNILLR